jgi:hypothetical protein
MLLAFSKLGFIRTFVYRDARLSILSLQSAVLGMRRLKSAYRLFNGQRIQNAW